MATTGSQPPNPTSSVPEDGNRWSMLRRRLWPYLLLFCLTWLAHFWMSGSFGLYEDDFTHISLVLGLHLGGLMNKIGANLARFADHGRPLLGTFIMIFSYVGWHLAGLKGMYLILFILVGTNGLLFYGLLRRLEGKLFAMLGGLGFVLFPADTTHAFLSHSFGMQPSLGCLLLAFHAYLSDRRTVAYALAALMLFTYETPFPVFLVAPLLIAPCNRKTVKTLGGHTIRMALILAVAVLLRAFLGESRVVDLAVTDAVLVPIRHMLIGPLVGFGAYFYKTAKLLPNLDVVLGITTASLTLVATLVLLWTETHSPPGAWALRLPGLAAGIRDVLIRRPASRNNLRVKTSRYLRLAGIGILMLVLAYPLTFTTTPIALVSRGTRVHAAGAVGAGLLWASFGGLALAISRGYGLAGVIRLAIAVVFGLSLSYDVTVQRDYVQAWHSERDFWQGVLGRAPDIGDGTMVLVEGELPPEPSQIGANTWAVPVILSQMVSFPTSWGTIPRVYRLIPEWKSTILTIDGELQLNGEAVFRPSWLDVEVKPDHVILLQRDANGILTRQASVEIGDAIYAVKPRGEPTIDALPKTALYQLLMEGSDTAVPMP